MTCCVGLFLFGVPNRGLNTQNLETLVKGQRNESLIRDLAEQSQLLRHQHQTFQQGFRHQDCTIVSFYETHDTNTVEVCVPCNLLVSTIHTPVNII